MEGSIGIKEKWDKVDTKRQEDLSKIDQIQYDGKSDIGLKRAKQEDCIILPDKISNLKSISSEQFQRAGLLFAVADGMGGMPYGDVISQATCQTVEGVYRGYLQKPSLSPRQFFEKAIKDVYKELIKQYEDGKILSYSGTTLTMLLLKDNHAYVCHIGDTRVYLYKKDEKTLTQKTHDHRDLYSQNKKALTRFVGFYNIPKVADDLVPFNYRPSMSRSLELDIFDFPVNPGNHLLLCSDGLSDVLEKDEILTALQKAEKVIDTTSNLIKVANQKGGPDNISVIYIQTQTIDDKNNVFTKKEDLIDTYTPQVIKTEPMKIWKGKKNQTLYAEVSGSEDTKQSAIYERCGTIIPQIPKFIGDENPESFTENTLKVYTFSTENIAGYIEKINLKNKKVAALSGSTDFAINAVLYGASSVDVIDVQPAACFIGELKVAGVRLLGRVEFLEFFGSTDKNIFGQKSFSYDVYQRLRSSISNQAQGFFDQLILQTGRHNILLPGRLIIDKLSDKMQYIRDVNPYLIMKGLNPYDSYDDRIRSLPFFSFDVTKESLLNTQILFYPQPIGNFLDTIQEQYDVIYLSNIFAYSSAEERQNIMQKGHRALTKKGKLVSFNFFKKSDGYDFVVKDQAQGKKIGFTGKQIVNDTTHNPDYGFNVLILEKM